MEKVYKSGFVSIIGKPNAGKSTLLNVLLKQKLSIITPKAQTTRHHIRGIDTGEDYQIVYSDTPGVIKPKYKLHEKMMLAVDSALDEADVIVLLIAADETFPEEELFNLAKKATAPIILAMNKIDLVTLPEAIARKEEIKKQLTVTEEVDVCALKEGNIDTLKKLILKHLPENPPYYDTEEITDRPERFFVAEMIREQIFLLMHEELPYSCEVSVLVFKDSPKIVQIDAEIHVERQSQKGMVIGKGGAMLKQIGTNARKQIETLLEKQVNLKLYVRLAEEWKDSSRYLKDFGY
ncbi:MAG: GTPase Era [Bacteroidia bacterium]